MEERTVGWMLGTAGAWALLFIIVIGAWGCPHYNVWQQGLQGQAELARAQQNRQVKVAEAQALEESAKHTAQAEIEKAKGVAEANRIIGESLHGNEAYLRWLWIEGLKERQGETSIVYIPTEAGLPILEAGKR